MILILSCRDNFHITACKAYKLRLYPSEDQKSLLKQSGGSCRWVWNYFLDMNIKNYANTGKYIFSDSMCKLLPELKKIHSWLKIPPSQSLQHITMHLERALKDSSKSAKSTSSKKGFPNFKKKSLYTDTFYLSNQVIKLKTIDKKKGKVYVPKIGWIKYKSGRHPIGKIMSATISQNGDHWYCSVICEFNVVSMTTDTNKIIGLDLGLTSLITTSDGVSLPPSSLVDKIKIKINRTTKRLKKITKRTL